MQVLRTSEQRFAGLDDFPYEPRYAQVTDPDGGELRMAWVEDGPAAGPAVVLIHGEPTWSYLYRSMIPVLAGGGLRVVVPDLVGFGRSDKPSRTGDHSYARHVAWLSELLGDRLGLRDATLLGQDWGGLLGLRIVAERPEIFGRVVAANTGLPTGDHDMPDVWWQFRRMIESADPLDLGRTVASGCAHGLSETARAAYDAPFPDEAYLAGPRVMPQLVPTAPDDPATAANRAAWDELARLDKPFLVAFSDSDPITGPMARIFTTLVPGAGGYTHPVLRGAGHFLQEDAGPQLAEHVLGFVRS